MQYYERIKVMASKPIRVLQVVPNMQQGGLENLIMNLYRNIDRTQIQFDFLEHYSADNFFDSEIHTLNGHIYRIPFMEHKTEIKKYMSTLDSFFEKHPEYAIVHGHMPTTANFYMKAAKKHGVKTRVVHAHEDSYIHNLRGYVRKILMQNSWRYATDLFACSQTSGEYLYGKRPFTVINNAIDCQRFTFNRADRKRVRTELGIADSTLALCHIGRFSLQKNHAFFLPMLKSLLRLHFNNVVLLLIGNGETLPEIRKEVNENNLGKYIRFMNTTDSPESMMSASDIFVLPSVFEGLPLTGIEAQCNGLPCIFSSSVTPDAAITGHVKFCSVNQPNSDSQEWADTIINTHRMTEQERVNSSVLVMRHGYDIRINAQKMQNFYLSRGEWSN